MKKQYLITVVVTLLMVIASKGIFPEPVFYGMVIALIMGSIMILFEEE
jgi:hypothetical protein